MRLLVLGGQLQGTEITYLAKQAGWDVTVVDKAKDVLSSKLCDHFICADIVDLDPGFLKDYDLVFPAFEDVGSLQQAKLMTFEASVSFAYDEQAYLLSRSKIQTNAFLKGIDIRIPPLLEDPIAEGTASQYSYIVKPDCKSGSKGLHCFDNANSTLRYINEHQDEGIFGQVFLNGPIYSIEVVCEYEKVVPYMVTEVVVDSHYDCHRIIAPADISHELQDEIRAIAYRIGKALRMRGIFDIEMVLHDSLLYVLEIDARMPSQTPIAIYHACGINLVTETARCFTAIPRQESEPDDEPAIDAMIRESSHAVLQHVHVEEGKESAITLIGEGSLLEASPLIKEDGFCGADLALVSKDPLRGCTYATLVTVEGSDDQAMAKMNTIIRELTLKVKAHD